MVSAVVLMLSGSDVLYLITHFQNLICLLKYSMQKCSKCLLSIGTWQGMGVDYLSHSTYSLSIFWKILIEKKMVIILSYEQRERRPGSH